MKYLLFFLLAFQLTSCRSNKFKGLAHVEGKGYCVEKYDKEGCNVCRFNDSQFEIKGWECENKACPEPVLEKANQCLKYKGKS